MAQTPSAVLMDLQQLHIQMHQSNILQKQVIQAQHNIAYAHGLLESPTSLKRARNLRGDPKRKISLLYSNLGFCACKENKKGNKQEGAKGMWSQALERLILLLPWLQ